MFSLNRDLKYWQLKSTPGKTTQNLNFALEKQSTKDQVFHIDSKKVKKPSHRPKKHLVITWCSQVLFSLRRYGLHTEHENESNASPHPTRVSPKNSQSYTVTFRPNNIESWDTSHQNRELSSDLFHKEESELSRKEKFQKSI